MLRARARGRLLQGEADYQLHIIYLWYEQDSARALTLLRGLQERYPGNPHFPAQIAHVQDTYEHDLIASLDTWRALLAAAREQRVNVAALAEVQARLGIARLLESLYQTDHAIEQLQAVVALKPDRAALVAGAGVPAVGRKSRSARGARRRRRSVPIGGRGCAARRSTERSRSGRAPASSSGGCQKGRGIPPVARGLAAARAEGPRVRERIARAIDRARSRRRGRSLPLRSRPPGAESGRRRARAVRAWHSSASARALLRFAETPSSKPRASTTAPVVATRRSTAIAPLRRSSAPQRRHARPRGARSNASTSSFHARRRCDFTNRDARSITLDARTRARGKSTSSIF